LKETYRCELTIMLQSTTHGAPCVTDVEASNIICD